MQKTYQFNHFPPEIFAFSTTKDHGSMSVSENTPEQRTLTNRNRQALTDLLNLPPENLILGMQVHGNKVAVVNEKTLAEHKYHLSGQGIPDVDALVTKLPNVCIAVRTSDCVPIVLYDPKNRIIAVAHAGWPGTVKKIAIETVETMQALGSQPANLIVGIGPSIGPCHFEISDDPKNNVIRKVKASFPESYKKLLTRQTAHHAHFNLWEVNKELLVEAGVKPSNIKVAGLCTVCHKDEFFSWRVNGVSQSFITGILLKN